MAAGNHSPTASALDLEHPSHPRKLRAHGVQARERILLGALRLFVARGYASTPVRDIAHDAGVNIAAIAYYFGDKAGLYRAALYEPMQGEDAAPAFDAPGPDLRAALARYLRHCLQPLSQGEASLLSVRLRFREAVEPTGMLDHERASKAELHRRLVALLARHAGVQPDPELEALAFSIFALVAYPYFGRDRVKAACPALFDAPDALESWVGRLADYAHAMAAADARRRTPSTIQRHDQES
ncbi:TetR/AcrR family transcriptional regulator [Massilia sp. 9096]|uniref:TetR/AcrR family transcriptional regulator n=1 Tax=Massilia sp. 9096 TaxID=1500894 RepID=UPI000690C8FE|nr:CerR family C-terminal domain-containing protein [Massilia sp. 9096]